MVKPRGKTGNHAEGQHGPETRAKIIEQLESGPSPEAQKEERAAGDPEHLWTPADDGKHRLVEGRQQHDDAEKQSERRRLENED